MMFPFRNREPAPPACPNTDDTTATHRQEPFPHNGITPSPHPVPAPAPHDRAGKPARESHCAPTAYAVDLDCIAAVGVSGIAPLTRCRGGDVVPTSVPPCAATAFAVGATAGAVFADCLAAQRHTAILHAFTELLYFQCFSAYLLNALRYNAFPTTIVGAPRRVSVPDMTVPRRRGEPAGHRLRARSARRWGI